MIVFSGAVYWRISAQLENQQTDGKVSNAMWSDEHSPNMKRYYNIMCLATGADPVRFIPMAVEDGMSASRLEKCSIEYKKKHDAWNRLIEPHARNFIDRALGLGGRLQLQMGPPGKNEYLVYEKMYQNGNFQALLDGISNTVKLPEDIPVIPRGCEGTVNAWWNPYEKKITLCHEMMQQLIQTFTVAIKSEIAAQQRQQQGQGGGQQPRQPQQQEPQPGEDQQPLPNQQVPQQQGGAMSIAGNWYCQGRTADTGEMFEETDALAPNGSWQMVSRRQSGFVLKAWGQWSTQGNVIKYRVAGYSPQQACNQNGCMPLNLPRAFSVPFQLGQDGTLRTQSGMCRRQ